MISQLKIERESKYTYIRCPICGEVLITNDPQYFLDEISPKKLQSLASCEHFQVIDVYKDQKSLESEKENFENAVLVIEKKKYFILVISRSS